MQHSLKKALLRKFLLTQCQKQNRTPLPSQTLSFMITIPPPLHAQPKQIETQNANQNNSLVNER
jgi:hypothetical protein